MEKGEKDCHLVIMTQRSKEGKYPSQAPLRLGIMTSRKWLGVMG